MNKKMSKFPLFLVLVALFVATLACENNPAPTPRPQPDPPPAPAEPTPVVAPQFESATLLIDSGTPGDQMKFTHDFCGDEHQSVGVKAEMNGDNAKVMVGEVEKIFSVGEEFSQLHSIDGHLINGKLELRGEMYILHLQYESPYWKSHNSALIKCP